MGMTGNSDPSFVNSVSYKEIIGAILKRFARLGGVSTAISVARKVPLLVVDEEGNVLSYDTRDPIGTINFLIDQHEVLYGEVARVLATQAAQPLAAGNDLLQELGLLDDEPISPMRVLLVDDHALFREGLVSLLGLQPDLVIVGQAGSVREAVALAEKTAPDLILMDLTLPDGTGVEATLAILAVRPEAKVIILTVHEEEESIFESIRAGAIGFLIKNVRAGELLDTLRRVRSGEAGISGTTARRILDQFVRQAPPMPNEAVTLTIREIEVLRELANNASNQEIAQRLVISENTVKNHVRNILVKLHFHNRRDAAEYARRHGITRPRGSI
jgi:DNA-binding NarL/FixJ family response regulator